jgi:hypothetical protein
MTTPDINRILPVPPLEAQQLWERGRSMPASTDRHDPYYADRIRLSENGAWVVRLSRPHDALLTGSTAITEYARLRSHDVDHISFGNAAISPRRLVTVTPWTEGLRGCTSQEYKESVQQSALGYFDEVSNLPNHWYLSTEIASPEQFSVHPELIRPFLVDVGPVLHKGPELARYIVKFLRSES